MVSSANPSKPLENCSDPPKPTKTNQDPLKLTKIPSSPCSPQATCSAPGAQPNRVVVKAEVNPCPVLKSEEEKRMIFYLDFHQPNQKKINLYFLSQTPMIIHFLNSTISAPASTERPTKNKWEGDQVLTIWFGIGDWEFLTGCNLELVIEFDKYNFEWAHQEQVGRWVIKLDKC